MKSEAAILSEILNAIGSRTDVRLWRQNTGVARTRTGQVVRFGVPGQADLSGILMPSGRRIEIEVKSATGRQSEAQRRWQRMIEKFGGLYVLACSVDDVLEVLP